VPRNVVSNDLMFVASNTKPLELASKNSEDMRSLRVVLIKAKAKISTLDRQID
jgi:hypothetical protein